MNVSPLISPPAGGTHNTLGNGHLNRSLPHSPTNIEPLSASEEGPGGTALGKHPSIPIWPGGPQPLHRGSWLAVLSCMGDVIVIMTSTMFLVHGSLVIYFEGVPVSEVPHLSIMQDASRYGPTVFPILFAAIVGQAMHAIAHWRLENGERMKVLDQLLGSTGLFSTIVTQLKFRNMGIAGLALICLWVLSPIGGQASLRVLDYGTRVDSRWRTLYAMDWNSTMHTADRIPLSSIAGDSSEAIFIGQSIFSAALASPIDVKRSTMDLWGNVKIPMVEKLTNSVLYSDGWREVPRTNVTYAALVGIPLSRVSSETNTTFTLETSYWTLVCPVLGDYKYGVPGLGKKGEMLPGWAAFQTTQWGLSTLNTQRQVRESDSNLTSRIFYYTSVDQWNSSTNAECHMNTTYVEVEVSCQRQDCSVTRIRPSTKPHPSPAYALGLDPGNVLDFTRSLFSSVAGNMNRPTAIQRYFRHPDAPFNNTEEDLALRNLTKTEFATSLVQLMNTYWLAGCGLAQVEVGVPTRIAPEFLPPRNASLLRRYYTPVNATETLATEVVRCSKPWLAALFIATGAMFLAGAFGLVLEFTRKAPDFALNISSLTRDNPYIHLPPGGSTLDSIDRSRLLQNLRIRLGDIKPDDPVGYIAIASCEGQGKVLRLKGLERTRTFS
ncbi:uncharacterized protein BDR25DRAFT_347112 [Lindgomyces ingoldianus]|uniref:Uncharacterized protein n=1 Tax=Lindgomyces ingoldianus TaxID=673940 RepID=A0ACB6Q9R2_9PLEO|nr:uncharacterized protein BDR25DRAFT_347112 [Lindgomyces ingoldianus]KAF2463620.1 hypothetical protein BDR25DRAFT_347112 [Lindgomyces ingoldianus]